MTVSHSRRWAVVVALGAFVSAAVVLVLQARPAPLGEEVSPLPPAGWYVTADTLATGIEPDEALRATADEWAAIATQHGYEGVRVFPKPQGGGSCSTGPDDGSGTTTWSCPSTAPAMGYVVVLRGPLSPPPTPDMDTEFDWYTRTRDEAQHVARTRGLPFEVGLAVLAFPSRVEGVGSSPLLGEAADLPDGWYRALTPGDITTDDAIALTAARAMAESARQAGYEGVRIVRWPHGPGPCDPWGCEDHKPEVVYVVVLDDALEAPGFAGAEEESAWRQQQQDRARAEAAERRMVATPFVVPLRFSNIETPVPSVTRPPVTVPPTFPASEKAQ